MQVEHNAGDDESSQPQSPIAVGIALLVLLAIAGFIFYYLLQQNAAPKPATGSTKPATTTQHSVVPIQLALFSTGVPKPTAIVSTGLSSDRRLFILDQDGLIRIVGADGSVATAPFLDLSKQVLSNGEMGLLGLAFSPHYQQDGYFFVDYIDTSQNSVIARYHVSNDPDVADAASGQTLLTLKQPYVNHNGGDLNFGPDGYLYVTFGDGGSAGDPQDRAQNLDVLFGKILRLDVSQVPYKIPATNPFASRADAAKEVWDYGLRNPWKISFDKATGDLYIADVGQGDREEIDVETAGGKGGVNYGWRCYEGTRDYNLAGCQARQNYTFPVVDYDHSDNRCAITGGYVYRGTQAPSMLGTYFYADYCGGQVYSLQKQNSAWKTQLEVQTPYKISAFGQDSRGELYLADYSTGALYRLETVSN